jgi:FixJ family two-component response regulator
MPGRVILLVDDDEGIRELMKVLCDSLPGVECLVAANLAEVQRLEPRLAELTLALLDINLGERQPTGVDVYRWLLETGFRGEAVFFSGHGARHPAVVEALKCSEARFIEKPIEIEPLIRLLTGTGP